MEIWNKKYKELEKFYKQYNHSNVPVRYKTQNLNLGEWVSYQRKAYKLNRLNTYQIDLLNKLDFSWEIKNNSKQSSIPEITIYVILKNLLDTTIIHRYMYKNIEFDIFIPDFNIAIEYDGVLYHKNKEISDINKNNICKINNIKLYRIREYGLKKLSNEDLILNENNSIELAIKYLANIFDIKEKIHIKDFYEEIYNYSLLDNNWETKYYILKEYIFEQKTTNIPSNFYYKNINIGNWLHIQRTLYKENKLSKEKIKKLKNLNLSLNYNNDIWEKYYIEAKKYYEKNNNLEIPYNYISNNLNLGNWITNQRHRYKYNELSKERIEKLNKIKIRWEYKDINQIKWMNTYNKCKAYLETNTRIPINLIIDDINIYNWVKVQKKKYKNQKYGKLTDQQIVLLKNIKIIE